MANKFWDTIKGIFKKPSNNENSTGATTSADPASAQPATQPTTTQPAQQAPVYKDDTVVRKNEQGNGGLYQYKATEQFKNANEVNQQYKYATSLGYNKDQALELLKNGTRWKEIALGQHGRPIKSYQGGRYTSQEEIAEKIN